MNDNIVLLHILIYPAKFPIISEFKNSINHNNQSSVAHVLIEVYINWGKYPGHLIPSRHVGHSERENSISVLIKATSMPGMIQ